MARPVFSLEQVRSFVAVAEHEHISRAAASLFLTQGAVTQQIRHFERAVGLQLLERDGRGVRLTDAGKTMAVACRAALRSLQVLEDTAESIKTLEKGSLHLGASPTCATLYLPSRLAGFTQENPGVKLSLIVEPSVEINRQVVAGAVDCGVVEETRTPSCSRSSWLMTSSSWWCTGTIHWRRSVASAPTTWPAIAISGAARHGRPNRTCGR